MLRIALLRNVLLFLLHNLIYLGLSCLSFAKNVLPVLNLKLGTLAGQMGRRWD